VPNAIESTDGIAVNVPRPIGPLQQRHLADLLRCKTGRTAVRRRNGRGRAGRRHGACGERGEADYREENSGGEAGSHAKYLQW
jgi:hypothetical protein